MWKVPLADIDLGSEEIDAVVAVLRSKWLTMGEVTQEFEAKFASYLGIKHAFAVANGTAALHLACSALGVGPGDEVIVPSLTFVASANSILYCGARPVFADVTALHDLNISPVDIERKITEHTKAIMVVHYGGFPCDMPLILDLARQYGLSVIADAAHAPGAELNGKKIGTAVPLLSLLVSFAVAPAADGNKIHVERFQRLDEVVLLSNGGHFAVG